MLLYYQRLGLLASEMLRPFDARHDGSLFGEGAGALMLETEASAAERNAPVLGEVLGGGYACEALGLIAIRDDGDGLARAIAAGARRRRTRDRRRRHDRRARQRHAAVRHVRSGGDPARVRCCAAAGDRVQVGDRTPIAAAGILETMLALTTIARNEVPGVATLETPRSRLRRRPRVGRRAGAAQQAWR